MTPADAHDYLGHLVRRRYAEGIPTGGLREIAKSTVKDLLPHEREAICRYVALRFAYEEWEREQEVNRIKHGEPSQSVKAIPAGLPSLGKKR